MFVALFPLSGTAHRKGKAQLQHVSSTPQVTLGLEGLTVVSWSHGDFSSVLQVWARLFERLEVARQLKVHLYVSDADRRVKGSLHASSTVCQMCVAVSASPSTFTLALTLTLTLATTVTLTR